GNRKTLQGRPHRIHRAHRRPHAGDERAIRTKQRPLRSVGPSRDHRTPHRFRTSSIIRTHHPIMKIIHFLPLITLLAACSSKPAADQPETATTAAPLNTFYVRTAPVEQSALDDAISVTALVQSDTEAKPGFKTGGVIAKTYVKEGDVVRKGQLIATLIMTEIEAQAMQAKLAVDKAQRDLQRVKNLYADSIATLEQLQNATTALDVAMKAQQIAEFNVAYSEVRSPIDGKVIQQLLREGEIAAPGMPVFYLMGVKA